MLWSAPAWAPAFTAPRAEVPPKVFAKHSSNSRRGTASAASHAGEAYGGTRTTQTFAGVPTPNAAAAAEVPGPAARLAWAVCAAVAAAACIAVGRLTAHLPAVRAAPAPAAAARPTMAMLATTGVAQPANTSQGPVHVSAAFDAGNIVVEGSSEREVNLRIRGDPYTKGTDEATHCQWFYFRASNVKGIPMTYNIVNAGEASYPTGPLTAHLQR